MTLLRDSEWETDARSHGGLYNVPERGHFAIGFNYYCGPDTAKTNVEVWDQALDALDRRAAWAKWETEPWEPPPAAETFPFPPEAVLRSNPAWLVDDLGWHQLIQTRHPIPERMATRRNKRFLEIEQFVSEMCAGPVINMHGWSWVFGTDLDALLFKLRFYGEMEPL